MAVVAAAIKRDCGSAVLRLPLRANEKRASVLECASPLELLYRDVHPPRHPPFSGHPRN